jgi:hypothetical protein
LCIRHYLLLQDIQAAAAKPPAIRPQPIGVAASKAPPAAVATVAAVPTAVVIAIPAAALLAALVITPSFCGAA